MVMWWINHERRAMSRRFVVFFFPKHLKTIIFIFLCFVTNSFWFNCLWMGFWFVNSLHCWRRIYFILCACVCFFLFLFHLSSSPISFCCFFKTVSCLICDENSMSLFNVFFTLKFLPFKENKFFFFFLFQCCSDWRLI